jgi:hypothetical protein
MSSTYTFDIAAFRISYPAFANVTDYPNVTLQMYFDTATCFIANKNYGYLAGDCRYLALTLMTAHLAAIATAVNSGDMTGIVQSATIDKVTLTLVPPPTKNQLQWWLNLTTYGQQLYTLLQIKAVGGFFIGGGCVRGAFRGGGVF